jgi:hypothetical protein
MQPCKRRMSPGSKVTLELSPWRNIWALSSNSNSRRRSQSPHAQRAPPAVRIKYLWKAEKWVVGLFENDPLPLVHAERR